MIKILWTAMNTTVWRCDATVEPAGSAVRASLEENTNAPPKRDEVSPSSTGRPKLSLTETDVAQTLADTRAKTTSYSTYIQMCGEDGKGLDITKFKRQLCQTMNVVREHDCHFACRCSARPSRRTTDPNVWPKTPQAGWGSCGDILHEESIPRQRNKQRGRSNKQHAPIATDMRSSWTATPRIKGIHSARI